MGREKERMMDMEARGIADGVSNYVCGECLDDYALAEFVEGKASGTCDYCDENEGCSLTTLAEHMVSIIQEEWTHPVEELPYESAEGGFTGTVYDSPDLFDHLGFEPLDYQILLDVSSHFANDLWCQRHYLCNNDEGQLSYGWYEYSKAVKDTNSCTCEGWSGPEFHADFITPFHLLPHINDAIVQLGLVKEFRAGTTYWRAQTHSAGDELPFPDHYTSPPLEFAKQPNRMSPAGVSMFYGAESFATAVSEVTGDETMAGQEASAARFESTRPLQILDLVGSRKRASYFASGGPLWHHRLKFLDFFSDDVSKPIKRDSKQHSEYLPTQCFTSFVQENVKSESGHAVDGIRYSSSLDDEPCVVLFFDQDNCLPEPASKEQALQAVNNSVKTVSLDAARK